MKTSTAKKIDKVLQVLTSTVLVLSFIIMIVGAWVVIFLDLDFGDWLLVAMASLTVHAFAYVFAIIAMCLPD